MSEINNSLCNSSIQQRHRTTPTQFQFLESYFQNIDDFPDSIMREKISQKLNMPNKSVHIWFQNRRAKRKQEERARLEKTTSRHSNTTITTSSSLPSTIKGLPLLSETFFNVPAPQQQQQHYLTNFASLKLPPLRNLAEESYARRHNSSKDVTLPPLYLAVPQILLGSCNVTEYHMNNCCKSPTQFIHSSYNIHKNQFSQPPPSLAQSKQQQRNKSSGSFVINDDSEPTATAQNTSKLSYLLPQITLLL
ncbi:2974_t:CDS:2 [Funneliformis caledonium]|uniref:2974_t:CDS:1 n=1 Tax=Funneliformis caledonium TaxID=1117310 RepID=A0A9N8VSB7_9GLOM|nr:2974_t:CDS:2 [Funneliformis caledonium]